MNILLDTNIIVDVALERQPFFPESQSVLLIVEQRKANGYVSASTFSDLYYIIRRYRGREWTKEFLQWLVTVCEIATVSATIVEMALRTDFNDFEDAIQYNTAIYNNIEVIITRNPQDFPVTSPQILTPSDFCKLFQS